MRKMDNGEKAEGRNRKRLRLDYRVLKYFFKNTKREQPYFIVTIAMTMTTIGYHIGEHLHIFL